MLERQTFTPAPVDVRALILAAATMPRAAVEASIEGLIALLDRIDGDPDIEDGHDAEQITALDGFMAPGVSAGLTDDHEPSEDREGVDEAEPGSWAEYDGETDYGTLDSYADDDREEDADDRMIRVRYRDRIRSRRCVPVRDAYWPFQINGRTPRAPFGREAAAVQPAAR